MAYRIENGFIVVSYEALVAPMVDPCPECRADSGPNGPGECFSWCPLEEAREAAWDAEQAREREAKCY